MGTVEGIFVAEAAAAPMRSVRSATAVAGAGLEGDRYARGAGTFSEGRPEGRALTLIAAEALDALRAEAGIALAHGDARRNLVTRGVDLDALLGRRFRIGGAVLVGVRTCPPCGHLQGLTTVGVVTGLQDRGGLRADIVVGGTIGVGDRVETLPDVRGAAGP